MKTTSERPATSIRRDHRVTISLSPDEARLLKAAAEDKDSTVTMWLRQVALTAARDAKEKRKGRR